MECQRFRKNIQIQLLFLLIAIQQSFQLHQLYYSNTTIVSINQQTYEAVKDELDNSNTTIVSINLSLQP